MIRFCSGCRVSEHQICQSIARFLRVDDLKELSVLWKSPSRSPSPAQAAAGIWAHRRLPESPASWQPWSEPERPSSDSPAAAWPGQHPAHWTGITWWQVMGHWTYWGQIRGEGGQHESPFTCCPRRCCAPTGGAFPERPPVSPTWLNPAALGRPWREEDTKTRAMKYPAEPTR